MLEIDGTSVQTNKCEKRNSLKTNGIFFFFYHFFHKLILFKDY